MHKGIKAHNIGFLAETWDIKTKSTLLNEYYNRTTYKPYKILSTDSTGGSPVAKVFFNLSDEHVHALVEIYYDNDNDGLSYLGFRTLKFEYVGNIDTENDETYDDFMSKNEDALKSRLEQVVEHFAEDISNEAWSRE